MKNIYNRAMVAAMVVRPVAACVEGVMGHSRLGQKARCKRYLHFLPIYQTVDVIASNFPHIFFSNLCELLICVFLDFVFFSVSRLFLACFLLISAYFCYGFLFFCSSSGRFFRACLPLISAADFLFSFQIFLLNNLEFGIRFMKRF